MKQHFREQVRAPDLIEMERFCLRCGVQLPSTHFSPDHRTCGSCGYVDYRNPLPCISVLIRDPSNRVLIGRRNSGKKLWSLPAGFVEEGENYLVAAHREVKEETNLDVRLERVINIVSNEFASFDSLVVVIEALKTGGCETPGAELTELRWFDGTDDSLEWEFQADQFIVNAYLNGLCEGVKVDDRYQALVQKVGAEDA